MRREDLERYPERGDRLGFQKETDDDGYVGWIMLNKRPVNERHLSLLSPRTKPGAFAETVYACVCPHQVWIAELRRDVYESGECESMDDYRLNKAFFFPTLDDVEKFVRAFGHTLEEIKWAREIEST